MQIQDGDPDYPSAPIPYASRIEQQIDWIAIDVLTLATRFKNWIKSKTKGR
jgi:hypothetical protein